MNKGKTAHRSINVRCGLWVLSYTLHTLCNLDDSFACKRCRNRLSYIYYAFILRFLFVLAWEMILFAFDSTCVLWELRNLFKSQSKHNICQVKSSHTIYNYTDQFLFLFVLSFLRHTYPLNRK